ncbi:MAG: amidohydrolase family protein [Bacteroidota bacterium]
MKKHIFLLTIILLFGQCSNEADDKTYASLIIHGGTIHTVNPENPSVEAVAISGDSIIFVGALKDAEVYKNDDTKLIDLEGKVMTPGLIEGHGHFVGMGQSKQQVDLLGTKSYSELLERVENAVSDSEEGEWITGRGWHQSKWEDTFKKVKGFPTNKKLSEISPDNPVFLKHASGHAAIVNDKALELAGIGNSYEYGEGGEVILDESNNPTGILNERAQGIVFAKIPKNTPELLSKATELAIQNCLEHGVTSFHDAGTTREHMEVIKSFGERNALKTRVYSMVSSPDESLLNEYLEKGPEIGLYNNFLTVRSIKIHADGALGSRGAWLLKEYTDRPGHFGHETTSMETVEEIAKNGLQKGFQVNTHAIGDRTNREVIDRYEIAFQEYPEKAEDHRFRIEHAQHINADDILRFSNLGIIPSMQAIHMSSDRPWAIDRLGEERILEGAYVWQKLIKSGSRIINGSDVPVEPIDPIASLYASIFRKTLEGEPESGYEPDQSMTRIQALESYTINGAYGAFEEDIKGTIEVGKLADFTVFDRDLLIVPEEDFLDTEVLMTIVGGEVLYEK